MVKTFAIGLAAASITLGSFALTPAFAEETAAPGVILVNAAPCMEQPNVETCPSYGSPSTSVQQPARKPIRHAHSHHEPATTQKG